MSKTINIQVTFDTDGIKQNYPNPSKNQASPTGIAHSYGYMVASSNAAISGSGTGDLSFSANVGDVVRFFGTSASENFEDSALIYSLPRYSGDQVFSDFESKTFTKSGVSPSGTAVLPATISDQKFWFFEADVIARGTENYKVTFAVYQRDSNGAPVLYGYYSWDPTIVVKG